MLKNHIALTCVLFFLWLMLTGIGLTFHSSPPIFVYLRTGLLLICFGQFLSNFFIITKNYYKDGIMWLIFLQVILFALLVWQYNNYLTTNERGVPYFLF